MYTIDATAERQEKSHTHTLYTNRRLLFIADPAPYSATATFCFCFRILNKGCAIKCDPDSNDRGSTTEMWLSMRLGYYLASAAVAVDSTAM